MHLYIWNYAIIGSDNGFLAILRQAITLTNADLSETNLCKFVW